MKNTMKKGFTLIELLVVITIIWILATGATSVYTSQIQKARDTTRINDVKALQSWVEQFYQDVSEYPDWDDFDKTATNNAWDPVAWVQIYVPKLPKDPKNNQNCNKTNMVGWADSICWYRYIVWDDENWITLWAYEISTAFENTWNITWKAAKDWWNTWNWLNRYEIWLRIDDASMVTNYTTANAWTASVSSDKDLVIAWIAQKK